ncbi:disulfide bond formation protein DsbB [Candidatus Williamhamiltonella defendens]|uniref:disulfide bond formation protein DsbB n=1 Tax=Candidatus Williamhamiltonella defendens TaxID=138072 RepID=UPI00130E3880|nr:disulfide bond formation protein DsbB [Candidatus Hamiltonella defensa]
MLQLLKCYSARRYIWFFIALTGFCFLLIALYFQHILLIPPCVLCIYQRCAFLGLIGASLLAAIYPKSLLRHIGILLWIYSSVKGLQFALEQVKIQSTPSFFDSCVLMIDFPSWLYLDKWLPFLFAPYSYCASQQWQLMSLDMAQWLIGIFSIYLFIGSIIFISQFVKPRRLIYSVMNKN